MDRKRIAFDRRAGAEWNDRDSSGGADLYDPHDLIGRLSESHRVGRHGRKVRFAPPMLHADGFAGLETVPDQLAELLRDRLRQRPRANWLVPAHL